MSSESSFAMCAFDKMSDVGLNYFFVIDVSCRLLYKNNAAKNSNFFKIDNQMIIKDTTDVFKDNCVKKIIHQNNNYLVHALNLSFCGFLIVS